MKDAMKVLYNYAQEGMLRMLLLQEDGYTETRRNVEKQEERFCALLDEQGREQLEKLLDERDQLAYYHGLALFRAGFRLAVELGSW